MPVYQMLMTEREIDDLIDREPFGHGVGRAAFAVPSDPSVIVKKQKGRYPGANIIEWELWHALKETELRNLFGECFAISETGKYLIMERLEDLTNPGWDKMIQVPFWFADRKCSAFGKAANGAIKIRDYASVVLERTLDSRLFPLSL